MALTRSFNLSSTRKQSIPGKNQPPQGQPYQNNNQPSTTSITPNPTFRLTAMCSDTSSGSDNMSDTFMLKIKERARKMFTRKKSSESHVAVIDTRYDCDDVPAIDLDLFGHGESDEDQPNHHRDCSQNSMTDCLTYPKG